MATKEYGDLPRYQPPAPPPSGQEREQREREKARWWANLSVNTTPSMMDELHHMRMTGQITAEEQEVVMDEIAASTENAVRSAAAAPFTLAPDLLGLAAQGINISTEFASWYMYGDDRGASHIPVISGDPIRELAGVDPARVGSAFVGELFGNWEAAIAKAPAVAMKMWNAAMASDPSVVLGTIMGARAANNLGDAQRVARMDEAARRLDGGENEATVIGDTGWYRGADGNMKFVISDAASRVNTDFLKSTLRTRADQGLLNVGDSTVVYARASEIFQHDELYRAYPELNDLVINIHVKRYPNNADGTPSFGIYDRANAENNVLGGYRPPWQGEPSGSINVFNVHKDQGDFGRNTILHELQHAIQQIEGFSGGANMTAMVDVANDFAASRVIKNIWDDLGAGRIDEFMQEEEMLEYVLEVAPNVAGNRQAIDQVMGFIDQAITTDASMVGDAKWLAELNYNQYLTEAVRVLQVGNADDIAPLIQNADVAELLEMARRRYVTQGGEVEARITELLRDRTQGEIDRLLQLRGSPEELAPNLRSSPVAREDITP